MDHNSLPLMTSPAGWLWITSLLMAIATVHAVTERIASVLTVSYRAYHKWEFVELCHDSFFGQLRNSLGSHHWLVRVLTSDRFYVSVCFATLCCATGIIGVCLTEVALFDGGEQMSVNGTVRVWFRFLLLGLISGLYFLMLRSPLGIDGSSYMLAIIGCSVLFSSILPLGALSFDLCVWFVCLQLMLSYFLAGITKLFGAVWRDGTAVGLILGSRHYGLRWAYAMLTRHRLAGRVLTYAILVFECSFIVILALPHDFMVALLAIACAFHVANAMLMGLGQFVTVFIAAYPAVFYCWYQLWGALPRFALEDAGAAARIFSLVTGVTAVLFP